MTHASSMAALITMNSLTHNTFERLFKAVGREKGWQAGQEALAQLGLTELRNQQDVVGFANLLIQRGGVLEAVGRALKIAAVLRGAVDRPVVPPQK